MMWWARKGPGASGGEGAAAVEYRGGTGNGLGRSSQSSLPERVLLVDATAVRHRVGLRLSGWLQIQRGTIGR